MKVFNDQKFFFKSLLMFLSILLTLVSFEDFFFGQNFIFPNSFHYVRQLTCCQSLFNSFKNIIMASSPSLWDVWDWENERSCEKVFPLRERFFPVTCLHRDTHDSSVQWIILWYNSKSKISPHVLAYKTHLSNFGTILKAIMYWLLGVCLSCRPLSTLVLS